MKICKMCNGAFPATDEFFYREKKSKSGLYARCKDCVLKRQKKYVKNNPEKRKQTVRNYDEENKETKKANACLYRKINKETISIKRKEDRMNNPEIFKEKDRKYRESHKELVNAIKNKYQRSEKGREMKRKYSLSPKGKEIDLIKSQKRMAYKKMVDADFDSEKWEKALKHFDYCCSYCGKHSKLEQDHFIPLSKGGDYTINNIIPACKSCNSSKNNRDFFAWYPNYKAYSKKREQKILEFLNYKLNIQQLALL